MSKCLQCKKSFKPKRNTKGKFCSYGCYWKNLRGKVPWNKGLKAKDDIRVMKSIEAAHKAAKEKPPWNKGLSKETDKRVAKYARSLKGMKKPWQKNENHHAWKGDKVGYYALHNWIVRHYGKPKKCHICGSKSKIEWANKDHKYKRKRKNWVQFCRSCHRKYDLNKLKIAESTLSLQAL